MLQRSSIVGAAMLAALMCMGASRRRTGHQEDAGGLGRPVGPRQPGRRTGTPSKPPGPRQEAPLTPEYQA